LQAAVPVDSLMYFIGPRGGLSCKETIEIYQPELQSISASQQRHIHRAIRVIVYTRINILIKKSVCNVAMFEGQGYVTFLVLIEH